MSMQTSTNLDGLLVAIYELTAALDRNTAANQDAAKWQAQRERTRERVRRVRVQKAEQEKESIKRDISPTPPIEKKAEVMEIIDVKEKEALSIRARARTRVEGGETAANDPQTAANDPQTAANEQQTAADEPQTAAKKSKTAAKKSKTAAQRTRHSIPPTIEEIAAYCTERKNGIDAKHFFDFYESKCWYVGKNKMRDWQAAVRTWECRNQQPENRVITIQKHNPTELKVTNADKQAMKEFYS